jgi:hypothetical protein
VVLFDAPNELVELRDILALSLLDDRAHYNILEYVGEHRLLPLNLQESEFM